MEIIVQDKNCEVCGEEGIISQEWRNVDFSGIKHDGSDLLIYFCGVSCRGKWNKEKKEREPYYAELDEAMNFCERFVRESGNEGKYIREGKEYPASGLWDYKSTPNHFKEWFEKEFGHKDYFKLHNRYN